MILSGTFKMDVAATVDTLICIKLLLFCLVR